MVESKLKSFISHLLRGIGLERFTKRIRIVLSTARKEAKNANYDYIDTEHLLMALVKGEPGVGATALLNLKMNFAVIEKKLSKFIATKKDIRSKLDRVKRSRDIIERAIKESKSLNHNYVGTEHLLLSLLHFKDGAAFQTLSNFGLDIDKVRSEITHILAGRKVITIFGTSKAKDGNEVFELAFEFGKLCAQAGLTIANGGYGGTMLAAAKGAKSAGGKTIGVTCSAFGRKGPNEFITETIVTENLAQRVAKLVEIGDAYAVLPGGTGTLLELAEIWELVNKGFVNPPKPIILIKDFWRPLVELMAADDPASSGCVRIASGAEDAVKILKEYWK